MSIFFNFQPDQALAIVLYCIIMNNEHQEGFLMIMRAGRAIKKGDEITNSYVDPQVIMLLYVHV